MVENEASSPFRRIAKFAPNAKAKFSLKPFVALLRQIQVWGFHSP
jgi:hypothetical protein